MSEKNDKAVNFSELFKDVKPVKQAQYVDLKQSARKLSTNKYSKLAQAKQRALEYDIKKQQASIELSDEYEAHWPTHKAIQYIRPQADETLKALSRDLIKKLKMGLYPPDIEVDFHGLTAKQAKTELVAVIFEATKRHYPCINIIHGHGNGVLKQKLPNWLVQHPDVIGFIQSPKAFGGKAGLLVIVNHPEQNMA